MGKIFLINPIVENQSKEIIQSLQQEAENEFLERFSSKRSMEIESFNESEDLIHTEGRIVVKIDMDSKDSWTFTDGLKIEYRRRFNNLNRSQTEPVNAIAISGEGINPGSEILIHFNGINDSNRIHDYKETTDTIRYYSIHKEMCFAWHDGNDWIPLEPYDFALRIFKPYEGAISGIQPTLIKDTLFVTSGELKDKVVKTIKASDFEIVFQGKDGREKSLIRFRPFGDEKNKREEEAIAILHDETEKVLSGELLVGYSVSDAKKLNLLWQK